MDDVSRVVAGKRQTITRQKVKMQKRLLNDNLKELYSKFIDEHDNYQLSYAAFCRLRPFLVVQPTDKTETPVCVKSMKIMLSFCKPAFLQVSFRNLAGLNLVKLYVM
jgi:hypothetical protein